MTSRSWQYISCHWNACGTTWPSVTSCRPNDFRSAFGITQNDRVLSCLEAFVFFLFTSQPSLRGLLARTVDWFPTLIRLHLFYIKLCFSEFVPHSSEHEQLQVTWFIWRHCAKKPVTTMLTYPWKCTGLHCNHLGNTWKPLVLVTRHFDYCPSASEGDNQSVGSPAPVVSRCFPGGYNVSLYISRGRLAWWLLAFCAWEILM